MKSTNLNSLPQELISIIVSCLSDSQRREKCAYSLISPCFLKSAQQQLWNTLSFSSNQQILEFIESDATRRGNYTTRVLSLNGGKIDGFILLRLMENLNRENYYALEELSLSNVAPNVLLNSKFTGLKALTLTGTFVPCTRLRIPFQLEKLDISNWTLLSEGLLTSLFNHSLMVLNANRVAPITGAIITSSLGTCTSLKHLSINGTDLMSWDASNYPPISTLYLTSSGKDSFPSLVNFFQTFGSNCGKAEPSILNLGLELILYLYGYPESDDNMSTEEVEELITILKKSYESTKSRKLARIENYLFWLLGRRNGEKT